MSAVRPGAVIAGRFRIDRTAGHGGAGIVYRCQDLVTGDPVALKVLCSDGPVSDERFGREIRVLSELDQPAVVRYVAHGDRKSVV